MSVFVRKPDVRSCTEHGGSDRPLRDLAARSEVVFFLLAILTRRAPDGSSCFEACTARRAGSHSSGPRGLRSWPTAWRSAAGRLRCRRAAVRPRSAVLRGELSSRSRRASALPPSSPCCHCWPCVRVGGTASPRWPPCDIFGCQPQRSPRRGYPGGGTVRADVERCWPLAPTDAAGRLLDAARSNVGRGTRRGAAGVAGGRPAAWAPGGGPHRRTDPVLAQLARSAKGWTARPGQQDLSTATGPGRAQAPARTQSETTAPVPDAKAGSPDGPGCRATSVSCSRRSPR